MTGGGPSRAAIERLLDADAELLEVFWANFLSPYEISGEDPVAAKTLLRALGRALEDNGSPLRSPAR